MVTVRARVFVTVRVMVKVKMTTRVRMSVKTEVSFRVRARFRSVRQADRTRAESVFMLGRWPGLGSGSHVHRGHGQDGTV